MRNLRALRFKLAKNVLQLKWKLLGFYYARLLCQARHLYEQSDLFRMRWQEISMEFAKESFDGDAQFFFHKAQKCPLIIRLHLFADGLLNRELRPYYISDPPWTGSPE